MWTIPNKQEANYAIQCRVFDSALADLVLARQGTGVRTGCGCTVNTGSLTVNVAPGYVQFDAAQPVQVNGQAVNVTANGNATLSRVDIVQVNQAGVASVVQGVVGAEPWEPKLSGVAVKLVQIVVPPNTTTALTGAMLSDRRVPVASPLSVIDYFRSTGEFTGTDAEFADFLSGGPGPQGPPGTGVSALGTSDPIPNTLPLGTIILRPGA